MSSSEEVQFFQKDPEEQGMWGWFINTISSAQVFDIVKIGLLIYFVLLAVVTVCSKGSAAKENTDLRQRLYRRFIFANFDVIKDLDPEEKTVMQKTFENTVKNAQKVEITSKEAEILQIQKSSKKKIKKLVEINLENNQTYFFGTCEAKTI